MSISWLRRVVPPGYATAQLTLEGRSPLLMHSADFDRDGEAYRAFRLLGQKRKKTLDDEARLRELDWELGLYLDAEIGPYIPGKNIHAILRSAATKWSLGEEVKRSLVVIPYRIPLEYDGPRDQAGLWAKGFRYSTMTANSGRSRGRVVRCRPMFPEWQLTAEIAYDPEDLDADSLALFVERTQKYGLGDYRPEFGSFAATLTTSATKRAARNGQGVKERDRIAVLAHDATVARIAG